MKVAEAKLQDILKEQPDVTREPNTMPAAGGSVRKLSMKSMVHYMVVMPNVYTTGLVTLVLAMHYVALQKRQQKKALMNQKA